MDRLNLDSCREILTLLPETFDSHDFIFAYLDRYERDYVHFCRNVFRPVATAAFSLQPTLK